jgi:hypothetical protein
MVIRVTILGSSLRTTIPLTKKMMHFDLRIPTGSYDRIEDEIMTLEDFPPYLFPNQINASDLSKYLGIFIILVLL